MLKCTACGGTYNATLSDGAPYFHACPPLSAAELAAAAIAGKVVLPIGETADVAVLRRTYERGNRRDENLQATSGPGAVLMKSAGAGTTVVAAPAPSVVVV